MERALFEHQIESVRLMEKAEREQSVDLDMGFCVSSSYGFLTNPIGSGKTATVLQLIKNNTRRIEAVKTYTRRINEIMVTGDPTPLYTPRQGRERIYPIETNLIVCPKPLLPFWEKEAEVMGVPALVIDAPKKVRVENFPDYMERMRAVDFSAFIVSTEQFGNLMESIVEYLGIFLDRDMLLFQRIIFDDIHSTAKWTQTKVGVEGTFVWFLNTTPGLINKPRQNRIVAQCGTLSPVSTFFTRSRMIKVEIPASRYAPPPIVEHTIRYRNFSIATRLADHLTPEALEMLHTGDFDGAYQQLTGGINPKPLHRMIMESYETRIQTLQTRRVNFLINLIDVTNVEEEIATVRRAMETLAERLRVLEDERFECPICYDDIERGQLIVSKCCHNTFCKGCIGRTLSRGGRCPMCRADINMSTFYSLQDDGRAIDLDIRNAEGVVGRDGRQASSAMEALKNLVEANPTGKFVVFSPTEGSSRNFKMYFSETDITLSDLAGSTSHIRRVLNDFENGTVRILFLCSSTSNAGLNLQFATDVVIIGNKRRMSGDAIAQSIGRVRRFPRTRAVPVHYITSQ
jgi:hypothetical protein